MNRISLFRKSVGKINYAARGAIKMVLEKNYKKREEGENER